jgi:cold shock CspA family protein
VLGKRHARQRLLTEADYFRKQGGPSGAMGFYDGLVGRLMDLPENAFLTQVGWGSGWESKTLGSHLLRQDDRQFEELLAKYRMTKEQDRQPGDPFPRSRHLALVDGHPALPMGWLGVRVEGLEEIEIAKAPAERGGAAPGQRTGRLKTFFPKRNYGFIAPDDGGEDIFVHVSGLVDPSATLRRGRRLAFDVEETAKGPRAVNVRILR